MSEKKVNTHFDCIREGQALDKAESVLEREMDEKESI